MSLRDVTSAVDALESSLAASVRGADDRTRFYNPMSLGAFADVLDELADGGWHIERLSTARAHVSDASAMYNLVADEDHTVAQLLQGKEAWKAIESVLYAHIHGDVGADVAPDESASKEDKLGWLKQQAERVAEAAKQFRDKRIEMAKDEAKAVKDAGRAAVSKVRSTAVALKRGAEKRLRDAADGIVDTVKGAAVTAGWAAAVPVGLLLVVGVVIFASAKSGRTQRRIAAQREEVIGGARQAGIF